VRLARGTIPTVVNGLDLLLLALLVLAGIAGYRRGFALQAFGFGGLLLGLLIAALLAPLAVRTVESPLARAGVAAALLLALAVLGNAAGWFVGVRARERARTTRLGRPDAVAGSAVALLASMLAIWFLALNLVNGPFPRVAEEIGSSAVVRALDAVLPEPPSLLAQARRLFNRFGFPDVFSGLPPPPGEPVPPPTQSEARAAVDAAAASTVRVVGRACDAVQEGSAFVVAPGYVVTNAHVIAGVTDPEVQPSGGPAIWARTVLFDPDVDLALLLVERTPGPPLPLAIEPLEPGAAGAVLGYPEGGPLDAGRAAVRRTMDALGRDIYGRGPVERLVLELQAEIRPGDSGGPFVLADGRVGGVVFAASASEPDLGYAIAAGEVQQALDRGVGETAEADTGPCLR
jgi:S1-C subfamily serine protease